MQNWFKSCYLKILLNAVSISCYQKLLIKLLNKGKVPYSDLFQGVKGAINPKSSKKSKLFPRIATKLQHNAQVRFFRFNQDILQSVTITYIATN